MSDDINFVADKTPHPPDNSIKYAPELLELSAKSDAPNSLTKLSIANLPFR